MSGMGRAVYLYLKGLWWESGGANGRESDRMGWVESQQVVEGGGIYKCECGGGSLLCTEWLSVSFPLSLSLPLAPPLSHHNPFRYKYTARPFPVILHPPAHEYGTDRGFRNVGY